MKRRDIRLLGQSFESLPPEERAEHYRERADAIFLKAQRSKNPEQRAEFLTMATGWHAMATELEKTLTSPVNIEPNQPKSAETKPEDLH